MKIVEYLQCHNMTDHNLNAKGAVIGLILIIVISQIFIMYDMIIW